MTHAFYIGMSYVTTGLVILCLIAWVVVDSQARKRELKNPEASGIRRGARADSTDDDR